MLLDSVLIAAADWAKVEIGAGRIFLSIADRD